MTDWADSEDHDFLNEFVGHRIDRIETGITDAGAARLVLHTNRGRALTITAEASTVGAFGPGLAIEEP